MKEHAKRSAFASVVLQAWPSDTLSLTCSYEWPEGVGATEAEDLDRALLEGIVEGARQVEQPPWRASVICPTALHKAGLTTATAVRIAAGLALQDLVSHADWIVEGPTPDEVA